MRKDFVRLGEHPWKTISGMQEKEFLFSIDTCADPGIFVRGVQVNLTKKALTTFFFFFFFFSPQLILARRLRANIVLFRIQA